MFMSMKSQKGNAQYHPSDRENFDLPSTVKQ